MVDVKHHDCNIRIFIVEFTAFVEELSLHFDDAVERLVGDQGLVPYVKLQQRGWMGPVDDCLVLPSSRAGICEIKKLTPVELEVVCS